MRLIPLTVSFSLFVRVFFSLQDALLDQLIGLGSLLDLVFQAICSHAFLEFALISQQRRGGGRVGEDIS